MNDRPDPPDADTARERSGMNPNVDVEGHHAHHAESDRAHTDGEHHERPLSDGSGVDPLADSPGAGVDDTESPEAVEPNEPG